MIKVLAYTLLSLFGLGFVTFVFFYLRNKIALNRLKKTIEDKLFIFLPMYSMYECQYLGGKTRLLTDFQLAEMENYKPGGIWYDEEKMPRLVTNYCAAPPYFVSFRYHSEGLSDEQMKALQSMDPDEREFALRASGTVKLSSVKTILRSEKND